MRIPSRLPLIVFALGMALVVTGCGPSSEPTATTPATDTPETTPATSRADGSDPTFAWPASLVVAGAGFPNSGDACRRIGESAATVDWLDNSASLAGCPSADAAAGVFRAQGGGRAIVIRSCQDRLPLSGGALADAARAARNAMVRSFAVDLAPHGIAVNAIAPNFFAGGWPQGRVRPFG